MGVGDMYATVGTELALTAEELLAMVSRLGVTTRLADAAKLVADAGGGAPRPTDRLRILRSVFESG